MMIMSLSVVKAFITYSCQCYEGFFLRKEKSFLVRPVFRLFLVISGILAITVDIGYSRKFIEILAVISFHP